MYMYMSTLLKVSNGGLVLEKKKGSDLLGYGLKY